jgi:uncharacterized protein YbjQ (UPF0145 family)
MVAITSEKPVCECGYRFQIGSKRFFGANLDEEITGFSQSQADLTDLSDAALDHLTQQVLVTTETALPDHAIVRRIDVITAECAFGINLFRDLFTAATDFFGGRSTATQKVLRDARRTCLFELRREALRVKANAVIGVRLDYSEFSGKGKSMLFLVASGTAVEICKPTNISGS